jgi:hypothetical protein
MFTSSVELVDLLSNYLQYEIDKEDNVSKICEIMDKEEDLCGDFKGSLREAIYNIYTSRLTKKFIDDSDELRLLLTAKIFDDGSNLQ